MTKGVFLIAFGNPCYGRAAYNLAISIKHYDKDLPICLLHDDRAFSKGVYDMSFFDIKIPLTGDMANPAKIKTSLYDLLPFDYNLYLDVDALCLKSLDELIEKLIYKGGDYYVFVNETYDINSPDIMPMMFWAYREDIWNHFNLNGEKLPATQSSIQFIKKSDICKKLFEQVNKNIDNPIPIDKLRNQWGGSQPDELYLNIALAQLGMNPHIGNDVIFFANQVDSRTLTKIQDDHYILSLFGGKNYTRSIYKGWYDRLMIGYCRAIGRNHSYKINYVITGKHADKRNGAMTLSNGGLLRTNKVKPKITLALTNYNRTDLLFKSYEKVLNDPRISEVIISDDCSDENTYKQVYEHVKDNPKIKMFRNEQNIGMSLNKKRAVELATNEWVILFDSDNIIDKTYIDRLWSTEWKENTIYAPEGALPQFNYKEFAGVTFNKGNIKQHLNKPLFDCLLNTCNYFVNKNQYLESYKHDETVKESDSIQFLYEWLNIGNSVYVVPRMTYQHKVHDGSGFMQNADYNLKKADETKQLIAQW